MSVVTVTFEESSFYNQGFYIPHQIFHYHPHFTLIFCFNWHKNELKNPRKSHPCGKLSRYNDFFDLGIVIDIMMCLRFWCALGGTETFMSISWINFYKLPSPNFIIHIFKKQWKGNGIVGIPITIFSYLVEMMLTATILYVYFLKIHNNGRLLDTYHRLHGEEDDFLVPYDLEVSSKELTNICVKSEGYFWQCLVIYLWKTYLRNVE